jgi:hypothetical protein
MIDNPATRLKRVLERATRNKRANNIFLRVENELVRRGEREGLK